MLGEQVEAVSVVPSALVIRRWDSGEVIADHPIGRDGTYEATFGAPYYGVHRVALLQALAERLAGEGLNLGRRCVGVDERDSGAELRFADGSSAAADLVVGADGVHSVIRPHVVGEVRGRSPERSATAGSCRSRRCRRCPIRRRCSSGPGRGATSCTTRSTAAGRSTSSPSSAPRNGPPTHGWRSARSATRSTQLDGPSSYLMKSPHNQRPDDQARADTEKFIAKYARKKTPSTAKQAASLAKAK